MEVDNDTDGDGELMIDEGPSAQPPILTKEVGKTPSSNQNGKSEVLYLTEKCNVRANSTI